MKGTPPNIQASI